MKDLLYKEFRLALHSTNIVFLTFAAMVFIPNYPYCVAVFFTTLGLQFLCTGGRENHDIPFTLLLPVRKRDVVAARMTMAALFEVGQLLLMVPCFLIKDLLPIPGNAAGMEANFALLGIALILLGAFNLVFFPSYYRDTSKVGAPFVKGIIPLWALMLLFESFTHFVPFFRDKLDTRGGAFLAEKLLVLALGAVVYAVLTAAAYRRSARLFETKDQ